MENTIIFYFDRRDEKTGKITKEEVALERWIWVAVYDEIDPITKKPKELRQFELDPNDNSKGVFHQFNEIDQDKVRIFCMLNVSDYRQIQIIKKKDMQIFHVYKICGTVDEKSRRENKIYCFGYKDHSTKQTSYHYILPDDTVLSGPSEINLQNFGAFN